MRLISLSILSIAALLNQVAAFDRAALSQWFMGLNPDKVVHAINCGSNDEIVDIVGVTYSPVSSPSSKLYLLGFRLHRWSGKRRRHFSPVGTA